LDKYIFDVIVLIIDTALAEWKSVGWCSELEHAARCVLHSTWHTELCFFMQVFQTQIYDQGIRERTGLEVLQTFYNREYVLLTHTNSKQNERSILWPQLISNKPPKGKCVRELVQSAICRIAVLSKGDPLHFFRLIPTNEFKVKLTKYETSFWSLVSSHTGFILSNALGKQTLQLQFLQKHYETATLIDIDKTSLRMYTEFHKPVTYIDLVKYSLNAGQVRWYLPQHSVVKRIGRRRGGAAGDGRNNIRIARNPRLMVGPGMNKMKQITKNIQPSQVSITPTISYLSSTSIQTFMNKQVRNLDPLIAICNLHPCNTLTEKLQTFCQLFHVPLCVKRTESSTRLPPRSFISHKQILDKATIRDGWLRLMHYIDQPSRLSHKNESYYFDGERVNFGKCYKNVLVNTSIDNIAFELIILIHKLISPNETIDLTRRSTCRPTTAYMPRMALGWTVHISVSKPSPKIRNNNKETKKKKKGKPRAPTTNC
jgi:hypothetical protein